jgi:hypothetical protein
MVCSGLLQNTHPSDGVVVSSGLAVASPVEAFKLEVMTYANCRDVSDAVLYGVSLRLESTE